jgi:hypothetical protein
MFAICVQYITERITLATFYRMPKPNGLEITFANNRLISLGPVFAIVIALWQHGNKAMFSNEKPPELQRSNQLSAVPERTLTGFLKSHKTIN